MARDGEKYAKIHRFYEISIQTPFSGVPKGKTFVESRKGDSAAAVVSRETSYFDEKNPGRSDGRDLRFSDDVNKTIIPRLLHP